MAQRHVALSVSQLIKVLEGFVGVKLSQPTIIKWLGNGYFPHAVKQAALSNSRWMIPVDDVVAYVKANYPGGPMTEEVDEDVQMAFNHIVALAYPVSTPSPS